MRPPSRLARGAAALLALIFAGVLFGCSEKKGEDTAGGGDSNIVLVVIDTTRADRLTPYGADEAATPFLAELAAKSAVFEQARSASSWTAPSTASLFTSLYPDQHGVWTGFRVSSKRKVRLNRIPAEAETIPAVLSGLGYRTFGASDNVNVGEEMGFARGFDRFRHSLNTSAESINAAVREWADEIKGGGKYFLYLHYMDPHEPYVRRDRWYREGSAGDHVEWLAAAGRVPEKALAWTRENLPLYDSEIGFVDAHIRELYDLLGWGRDTLLIVTADHGEEFYDHGGRRHRHQLYDELVRVPLIVSFPGRVTPGRVAAPVSLLDVLPTLRAFAGGAPSPSDEGVSLLPYLAGEPPGERTIFSMRWREHARRGKKPLMRRAVFDGRWACIISEPPGSVELYDTRNDPREERDLAAARPALAGELRSRLEAFEASAVVLPRSFNDERALSEAEKEHLRSLGYAR